MSALKLFMIFDNLKTKIVSIFKLQTTKLCLFKSERSLPNHLTDCKLVLFNRIQTASTGLFFISYDIRSESYIPFSWFSVKTKLEHLTDHSSF